MRAARLGIVVLGACGLVALLAWGVGLAPPPEGEGLSRRELFAGGLTLGVLLFALYGFDLRDWF